jgi:nifR3 family TIM-barrel protein
MKKAPHFALGHAPSLDDNSPPPILLAPMAGFTDAPMRLISGRFGAAVAYTEMANARGVANRAEASLKLLEPLPGEPPLVAHLYGAEPDDFARAAEIIAEGGQHVGIDINCGCPVPKVRQCGAGASLIADPQLIGRIVKAVATHANLPVTVKTRVGLRPNEDVVEEIARVAADNGAAAIAVHGRYATQHHSGPVHYNLIQRVVKLERISVIGNGGIRDVASAKRMAETGCAALMVGWAAVGNPWLFRWLREWGENSAADVPHEELKNLLKEHLELSLEFRRRQLSSFPGAASRTNPEEGVVLDFRCHLFRYLNGIRGVSRLRGKLSQMHTLVDIRQAVDDLLE